MIAALAAIIGGIVVFGSNTGTSKQAAAALKQADAVRTALIDRINPRPVE